MKKLFLAIVTIVGLLSVMACSTTTETTEPTIAPTEPPSATEAPQPTDAPEQAGGVGLNGYTNVIYTEADGALVGNGARPQFFNIYATW